MVPSSVWFFRFSNDKIFENPAGEKNSQTYLTDFIKEQDPIFERQSKVTKVINETFKCYQEEALERAKEAVKQSKLETFFTKAVQNSDPGTSCQKSYTVDDSFETSSIEDEQEKDRDISSGEDFSSDED